MRFLIPLILLSSNLFAVEATDILGFWFISQSPSERVGIAEFAQKDGKFYANAFTYRDKRRTKPYDVKNPDPNLRHRILSEVILIYGLVFDGESWTEGKIYNPENGKSYYLKGKLSEDKKSIEWRASMDKVGVLGKNIVWKRIDDPSDYIPLQHPRAVLEANIPRQD